MSSRSRSRSASADRGAGSGWQLDADSASSEAPAPPARLPPATGGAKRRGRPKGLTGSHFYRRQMREQRQAGEFAAAPSGAAAQTAPAQEQHEQLQKQPEHRLVQTHSGTAALFSCVRPVGPDIVKLVVAALGRDLRSGPLSSMQRLISQTLGPSPRMIAPLNAEAACLQMSQKHLPEELCALAAAVHWANRAFLGSALSHIRRGQSSQQLRCIGVVRWRSYDSTPLRMAVGRNSRGPQSPEQLSYALAAAGTATPALGNGGAPGAAVAALHSGRESQVCKILQSEYELGVLVEVLASGRRVFLRLPATCPLQVSDHETAESLRFMHGEQSAIPLYDDVLSCFEHRFELSTCDSASANTKFETLADAASPRGSSYLRFACDVHHVGRVQVRGFGLLGFTLSGCIALGLACKPGGAPRGLRECIAEVLKAPPGSHSARTV